MDASSQESQRVYISHSNPPYYLIYTRCASNLQTLWVTLLFLVDIDLDLDSVFIHSDKTH